MSNTRHTIESVILFVWFLLSRMVTGANSGRRSRVTRHSGSQWGTTLVPFSRVILAWSYLRYWLPKVQLVSVDAGLRQRAGTHLRWGRLEF